MELAGSWPCQGCEPSLRIWAFSKLMKNPPDRLLHPTHSPTPPSFLSCYLNLHLPGLNISRKVMERRFKVKCNKMILFMNQIDSWLTHYRILYYLMKVLALWIYYIFVFNRWKGTGFIIHSGHLWAKMHHFPWVVYREDFVGGYMSFKQIFKDCVNF